MSYLNNKHLDIVLEEHSDFGYRLAFESLVTECVRHPVTGEETNCKDVRNRLDVSNLEFSGAIGSDLGDDATTLATFTFSLTGAANGIIEFSLSKEVVDSIAQNRPSTIPDGTRNRLIGYYDILSRDPVADITTRIMEGNVYVSEGVTS